VLLSLGAPTPAALARIAVATLVYFVVLDLVKVAYYKRISGRRHAPESGDPGKSRRLRANRTPAKRVLPEPRLV